MPLDALEDTDEIPVKRMKDRRNYHWRSQDIAILFALAIQLGGLIWGAATLKSGVDQTKQLISELRASVDKVDDRQRTEEINNARRQGRVDALENMIVEIRRERVR